MLIIAIILSVVVVWTLIAFALCAVNHAANRRETDMYDKNAELYRNIQARYTLAK